MSTYQINRRSHCVLCGRRLSSKDLLGDIRWQPSNVDDRGLICNPCYSKMKKDRTEKVLRTEEQNKGTTR